VLIGATPHGRKELVGFTDGALESAQDWRDLLLDLNRRGLTCRCGSPSSMARSGSGRPPVRSGRKHASSAAGFKREPKPPPRPRFAEDGSAQRQANQPVLRMAP
jgi:hypothetical protein